MSALINFAMGCMAFVLTVTVASTVEWLIDLIYYNWITVLIIAIAALVIYTFAKNEPDV